MRFTMVFTDEGTSRTSFRINVPPVATLARSEPFFWLPHIYIPYLSIENNDSEIMVPFNIHGIYAVRSIYKFLQKDISAYC